MTITQLLTSARRRYNSVNDSFFADEELINILYDACLDFARTTLCIERVYTTSTVASQQEYSYPTSAIAIKRIQYNGKKLQPINMRQDDSITALNQSTTATGDPQYYFIYNETIYLRPVPAGVGTLKIWTYNEAQELTVASTLEIPTQFHLDLVDYMASEMAAKDLNFTTAKYYLEKWERRKAEAKKWTQKKKRTDGFASVMDEEISIETYLGVI